MNKILEILITTANNDLLKGILQRKNNDKKYIHVPVLRFFRQPI